MRALSVKNFMLISFCFFIPTQVIITNSIADAQAYNRTIADKNTECQAACSQPNVTFYEKRDGLSLKNFYINWSISTSDKGVCDRSDAQHGINTPASTSNHCAFDAWNQLLPTSVDAVVFDNSSSDAAFSPTTGDVIPNGKNNITAKDHAWFEERYPGLSAFTVNTETCQCSGGGYARIGETDIIFSMDENIPEWEWHRASPPPPFPCLPSKTSSLLFHIKIPSFMR